MRLALGLLFLASLQSPAPGAGQDGSLESFLRKIRAEREAEFGRLRGRVEALVAKLALARTATDKQKLQAEADALGSEAAPLFLAHLDPGDSPGPERERQGEEIAAALMRSKNPAIQDELARLARQASPAGRILAVRVLGAAADPVRAQASLRALFPDARSKLRAECVRSLAELDRADPLIEGALSDPQSEVVGAALEALTPVPRQKPLDAVITLARDPNRPADVLAQLVTYLRVPGQTIDEETVAALLRLACRQDLPTASRLAVLDGFPRFGLPLSTRLRKEVEPLLDSADSALREGALIALARLKDSKARRDLLKYYDDLVRDNGGWSQAYQRRGDVELKIGEYRDAVKDYRNALAQLGQGARLPANRELWINLARALVLDDKLKLAAEALGEFGLTSDIKRELLEDPDFAALRESRYRKLLE